MTSRISNVNSQHQDNFWSFNKVLELYEAIEKDLHLDDSLINGVPWWDSLRYPLFQEILRDLRLRDDLATTTKAPLIYRKVKNGMKLLSHILSLLTSRSPLMISDKSILVWGHARKKFDNGLYTDIYSDPFVELFPDNLRVAIIARAGKYSGLKQKSPGISFCAESLISVAVLLSAIASLLLRPRRDQTVINILESRLLQDFQIKYNLKNSILRSVANWHSLHFVMTAYFRLKRPSHFFIVVSAGHEPVIAAAKAANIPTIELQHGSPSRGKLNYDYSSGISKSSFPDYFLSFGEYWKNSVTLPIPKDRNLSFGFPYLANKISFYSMVEKENILLVVSQPVFATSLARFAIKALGVGDIKVVFKPHPSEFVSDAPDYFRDLRDAGVFIAEESSDIYFLFSKARWQVGVFSTALYEGLCFNVALFLLPLPGFECMEPLVTCGLAKIIRSVDDLDLSWSPSSNVYCDFFAEPSKEKLLKILSLSSVPSNKTI